MESKLHNLHPGDVIDTPPPASSKLRLRVRERNTWPGGCQYALQLYTTKPGSINEWAWLGREHDIYLTPEEMDKRGGYVVVEIARKQLTLF